MIFHVSIQYRSGANVEVIMEDPIFMKTVSPAGRNILTKVRFKRASAGLLYQDLDAIESIWILKKLRDLTEKELEERLPFSGPGQIEKDLSPNAVKEMRERHKELYPEINRGKDR